MSVTIHHGDSRDVLKTLADASVDSVVCDPPYALVSIQKRFGKPGSAPAKSEGASGVYARASAGFMGQQWDTGETAFDPEFWCEVWRVLKPGAHLVAFSGTRTYHRLACAIEDAGFELRDMIAWLYGSGFPKSHNVSKAIDKAAGLERRVIAEGAPVKRMIPGADQHMGGWEKNNGREYVPTVTAAASAASAAWEGWGTALKPALEPIVLARKPLIGTVAENVLEHGCGALNIEGCRIDTADELGGGAYSGGLRRRDQYTSSDKAAGAEALSRLNRGIGEYRQPAGRWPANIIHDGSDEVVGAFPEAPGALMTVGPQHGPKGRKNVYGEYGERALTEPRGDAGSAARFFYAAKAGPYDRFASKHPTVKPVELMRWLCRLVTPPGGTVLDPFAGTGTTGAAAMVEGFDAILIEREATFVSDIKRRIAWMTGDGPLTAQALAPKQEESAGPLFGDAA